MDCPACGQTFDSGMIDKMVNVAGKVSGYFCNVCATKYGPGPEWPHCPACGDDTGIEVIATVTIDTDHADAETVSETAYVCGKCNHRFRVEAAA